MDITGQYFCSFNIKGQPYNEEFKIVLEASVSVYNELGELQTCIVSKLPSKQIIIKTLMKESLEQGLELSDVVFDEQIDDCQDDSHCKAVHRYDETSSVKGLLERKKIHESKDQQGVILRNNLNILQKIRLDCFWIHLPDAGTKDNDTIDGGVKENPPITIIHKRVIPVEPKPCDSQQNEIQNVHSQTQGTVSLLNDAIELRDNILPLNADDSNELVANSTEIKTEHDAADSIKNEGNFENSKVVPVGLPFKTKHESMDCGLLTENERVEPVTGDIENATGSLVTSDAVTGSGYIYAVVEQTVENNLNDNIEFDETLNATLPDADNIETNEVVEDVDNDNGQLMLFCADVRKNEIGAFVNVNAEGAEISLTEQQQNELSIQPVILDHTYKKTKIKARKQYKKKGNPKAAVSKTDFKTRVNNFEVPNVETAQSDTESYDISSPRKRRRCSRNVDYKALVGNIDSEESESDDTELETDADTVSSEESQEENNDNEAPSEAKKPKIVVDPDYQPSDLSGESGGESNTDEGGLSDISLAEEDKEKILEQIEKTKKKRKLTYFKTKVNLEEHEDKFEIVKFVSTEQRNRGKSLEEKSHDSFACKICNSYQTADKDLMSIHIGQHLQGKLRCNFCEIESSSVYRNIQHMKGEHPTKHMSISTVCEQCGIPFSDNYSRQRHMYNVHKIPAFDCRLCRKQDKTNKQKFATLKELRQHTKESHPGDIYQCDDCGSHYTDKNMYKKHKFRCKNKSDKNGNIQCSECSEIFESKDKLRKHCRRAHRKEKLCKCTMCDYAAFCVTSVTRHMAHAHLGRYIRFSYGE